jgi:hypothetical protein
MKAPEIFGLIVRTVGVFLVYQTILVVIGVISVGNTHFAGGSNLGGMTLLRVVAMAGAAVWFLFGAPPLQKVAYPETPASNPSPSNGEKPATPPAKPQYDGPPCVSCGQRMPANSKTCPHCGWTQP